MRNSYSTSLHRASLGAGGGIPAPWAGARLRLEPSISFNTGAGMQTGSRAGCAQPHARTAHFRRSRQTPQTDRYRQRTDSERIPNG
jgi:hypothetical protein